MQVEAEKDTPPVPDIYQETVSPSGGLETVALQDVKAFTAIVVLAHKITVVVAVLLISTVAEVPELAP